MRRTFFWIIVGFFLGRHVHRMGLATNGSKNEDPSLDAEKKNPSSSNVNGREAISLRVALREGGVHFGRWFFWELLIAALAPLGLLVWFQFGDDGSLIEILGTGELFLISFGLIMGLVPDILDMRSILAPGTRRMLFILACLIGMQSLTMWSDAEMQEMLQRTIPDIGEIYSKEELLYTGGGLLLFTIVLGAAIFTIRHMHITSVEKG